MRLFDVTGSRVALELCNSTYGDVTLREFSAMKNFISLAMRVGGLLFGIGLFVVGSVWLLTQAGLFMKPWEANDLFDTLKPALAFGGAMMGIGAQGVAISLILRCGYGAFRYASQMVGLKEAT